jgi:hypothetical protein
VKISLSGNNKKLMRKKVELFFKKQEGALKTASSALFSFLK